MSALTVEDHLWLRLWSARHRGASIKDPTPVPERDHDPWPLTPRPAQEDAHLCEGFPGTWTSAGGGSGAVATFLSDDAVLRIARSDDHSESLRREGDILSRSHPLLPRLLDRGDRWLLLERLTGRRPDREGPWLEQLGVFAADLRHSGTSAWTVRTGRQLENLRQAVGHELHQRLTTCIPAHQSGALVATHGDLHCGNLLVDQDGNLTGVVDFEGAAMAYAERDTVIWLTVMSGQIGLRAVRRVLHAAHPDGIDPFALHAEMLRALDDAAEEALEPNAPPERLRTVCDLASILADDCELPARLAGTNATAH